MPHVRESKTILKSEFHAVDSGFQVLDSVIFVSETRIRISDFNIIIGILSTLISLIELSSGFHTLDPSSVTGKTFPDSGIRIRDDSK